MIPSLVTSLGSGHVLFCSPPGSDSALGSDVLTDSKGEALKAPKWERGWGRGNALGYGDSLSGTF